jgi:ABC-type Fe3+-siderophore transport system permease subunit
MKITNKKQMTLFILILLLFILSVVSINFGKMSLSPSEVWQVFTGSGTVKQQMVVFDFRLPRIILGIFVGIGMGVSGVIMQSLLKNDMASPGTLGISSGSGLFVLMYIVLFKADSPTGLILTGVAVGSGYGALTTMLSLKLDERQMDFIQKWQAGNLWGDDWKYLNILVPWILILSIYTIYKSNTLNTIHLGNDTAMGLGVAVKKEFISLMFVAVALSSGSVALGGNFFFVGMIAPHMARKLVGANHFFVIPVSGLLGGIIIILADTITRSVSLGSDVPTGIVITVLSTPYFLYLLSKAD